MTLVSVDGAAKRHADRLVLSEVTFAVSAGERVGVIGVNGSGKSTLLRLVAGVTPPDAGRVVHASGTRVAFVPQEPALDPDARVLATVVDADTAPARAVRALEAAQAAVRTAPADAEAIAGLERATRVVDAERAWDLERRALAILDRLGLRDADALIGTLSGGQRKRVALARGLATEAEVLVLDEPTNHLDVDAVEWLESELFARSGALVLVTHDRYLLDRLATRILEVEGGGVRSGHGSYSDYLEARALREEQEAAEDRRRENRARVELAWLERGPKARTSKARYRVERAHDLLDRERPVERAEVQIALPSRRIGSKVVNLHNAGVRYGDRWVLREVEHKLAPDARTGIVGPNGAGKTTLLALLAGRRQPDEGSVRIGETVHVGWYGQELEALPAQQRLLDAVQEVVLEVELTDGTRPGRKVRAPELLERFLFPSQMHRARVGDLSGGERRRLQLLRVLAELPNLLLLDEPTNDLDLDTLGVLEEFLDDWPGAVVVASHDRYFLDRVCRDLFSVADGRVRHHPGGWSQWREAQRSARAAARRAPSVAASPSPPRADAAGDGRKLSYNEQRELALLDERLEELALHRADLESRLVQIGDDHVAMSEAGRELARTLAETEAAEHRWLELAERKEA